MILTKAIAGSVDTRDSLEREHGEWKLPNWILTTPAMRPMRVGCPHWAESLFRLQRLRDHYLALEVFHHVWIKADFGRLLR
jgi:hypothetical protein